MWDVFLEKPHCEKAIKFLAGILFIHSLDSLHPFQKFAVCGCREKLNSLRHK
jgi:hypothetical protein